MMMRSLWPKELTFIGVYNIMNIKHVTGKPFFICLQLCCACFLFACAGCAPRAKMAIAGVDGTELVIGKKELHKRIEEILTEAELKSSTVGIKVMRLSDKAVLYQHNAEKIFHPASTMKLFTAAAALRSLGPAFRFATELARHEDVALGQTLNGDIFLIGSGDPSLVTEDLAGLAVQLYSQGVRTIRGNIVCDDSFLDDIHYGAGWMWDDQPYKDFAPIGALSVNRNTVEIFVSPGAEKGALATARLLPATRYVQLNNEALTQEQDTAAEGQDAPLTVLRRWQKQSNCIDVRGAVQLGSGEKRYERNIYGPTLYTGNLFFEECEKVGIRLTGRVVRGKAPENVTVIASHHSAELAALIMEMNKQSHNLYAELFLKVVGAWMQEKPGTAQKGIEVLAEMMTGWGVSEDTFRFADGSGVSRYGLVSPDTLLRLLEKMYDDFAIRHEFVASLPIAGVDGSLKERMQTLPAQGVVHAKTGSLSGVSALAGFTESSDNEELAFVVMMEHFIGPAHFHLAAQDRICDILCRYVHK